MNDGLVWRDLPLPEGLDAELADLAWHNGVSTDELIKLCCQLVVKKPLLLGFKPFVFKPCDGLTEECFD